MQVEHTLSEGLKHKFTVKIPSSKIKAKVLESLAELGKNVKFPGFRPGKVPETILRQRYGARALQEATEETVQSSVQKIFADNKIRQAFQPKIEVKGYGEDKDLEFTIAVESLPEIKLNDFKKLSLEQLNVNVGDEEIEKRLNEIAKHRKKFVPLKKPRPSQKGDLVSFVILEVTVDGKPEKNFNKNGTIELGHARNVEFPELDKELTGANIQDKLTVNQNISFDEDDDEKKASAKKTKASKAIFQIKVSNIEEPAFFTVNDDLAKEFNLKSIDELRKNLKEGVEVDYKKLSRLHVKRFLLDKLAEEYKFDLPPTLVESEFEAIWTKLQEEIKSAQKNGQPIEEDKNEKELRKEYRAIAERRVRLGLLISEVSKINKIQVTEEELRSVIFDQAMRNFNGQINPDQIAEYFEYYRKNPGAVEQIAAPLLEDKVVDFILKGANVSERTVDSKTFKKAIRGVIPSPYDDEEETESKPKSETKSKPKANVTKPKAKKSEGKKA